MQVRLAGLLLKFLMVIGSMTAVVFAEAQELIVFDGKSWTVPHVYIGYQDASFASWPYYSDGRLILVPGGQILCGGIRSMLIAIAAINLFRASGLSRWLIARHIRTLRYLHFPRPPGDLLIMAG